MSGCKNLQSVVISEGVTPIGSSAFYGCLYLTVTFDGTKEEWEKRRRWKTKECEIQ